jgi:hypothetical protein
MQRARSLIVRMYALSFWDVFASGNSVQGDFELG